MLQLETMRYRKVPIRSALPNRSAPERSAECRKIVAPPENRSAPFRAWPRALRILWNPYTNTHLGGGGGLCLYGIAGRQGCLNNHVVVTHYKRPNGHLTRYANLRVAHESGMPGTFSPPPWVSDPDMHHGTCVTHVPCCMPGSLTSGFLWSRWWGKRSRHSRGMINPQFYVSGKRPMAWNKGVLDGALAPGASNRNITVYLRSGQYT